MTQEILKYQELDGQIRRLEKELAELPERKKAADLQNRLKAGQVRLATVEQNAQKTVENFDKAKAYYEELFVKIETLSKAIADAGLEKVKDLQKAKSNFYQMIEKLEKELSKISAQLTMVNNEYSAIIKNAKIAKTQLDEQRVKFAASKQRLEPQIAKLKAEQQVQAAKVDKTILDKYNAKRESKFPVFVKNINGTCGGCRMAISASKMREFNSSAYIECENCGRIIIKD